MTAGLNSRATIWRFNQEDDDTIGGSVFSGTAVYTGVMCGRVQAKPIEQVLLQQGLDTLKTFDTIVVPGTLDIRERDEFEITHPFDDPYINKRFRIVGVRYSDHNPRDPRNYIMLSLTRSVEARREQ